LSKCAAKDSKSLTNSIDFDGVSVCCEAIGIQWIQRHICLSVETKGVWFFFCVCRVRTCCRPPISMIRDGRFSTQDAETSFSSTWTSGSSWRTAEAKPLRVDAYTRGIFRLSVVRPSWSRTSLIRSRSYLWDRSPIVVDPSVTHEALMVTRSLGVCPELLSDSWALGRATSPTAQIDQAPINRMASMRYHISDRFPLPPKTCTR